MTVIRRSAIFIVFLAGLSLAGVRGAGRAAEPPADPQAERRRRASVLADVGRLRLELGTASDLRAALAALQRAALLDPANIRARYWLGAACVRSAVRSDGKLEAELVGKAGLEFEAVFKMSSLDRSSLAADLRRRAVGDLDACAGKLSAGEERFTRWWKLRRAEVIAAQALSDMTHVVVRGDTLATIARKYYGDAGAAKRIAKANSGLDPRRLFVGKRIRIPAVPIRVAPAPPHLDRHDRELVKQLRSAGMAAERRVASERLGRRDCLAAATFLVDAMRNDSSSWVRGECARALGRLGSSDAEPALCAMLSGDTSAHCRGAAAEALGAVGGLGAQVALLSALSDRSASVAAAAARALGARKLAAASGPLTAALSARNESLRRAAAEAIGDLAAARRLSMADFRAVKRLATDGKAGARAAALLALAAADATYAEKILPPALDSSNASVRRAACEAASRLALRGGGLEHAVIGKLLRLCAASDATVRFGAALAVARARRGKAEARPALRALVAMLGESRAIRWGPAEAEIVSGLALRALREASGKRLPPDSKAWKAWLERN